MTDENTGVSPSEAEDKAPATELPFVFTGNASEFFGIWIVNLILSILTLGIYSPWAKVRTNRYFYGSTRLDGDAFSYHAKPLSILIARIIVVGVILAVSILAAWEPRVYFVVYPIMLFLLPWLITRSLRFQSRVTRWRNVSFDWRTDYWPTFVIMYLVPIFTAVTLFLGTPFASKWTQKWAYNRLSFGDRPFSVDPNVGRIYGLFFGLMAIGLVLYIVGLSMMFGPMVALEQGAADTESPAVVLGMMLSIIPGYLILLSGSLVALVYQAGVRNIVFDSLTLDGVHTFRSTISKRKYAWIIGTNLLAVLFSFGFLTPWARIRIARYVAECTFMIPGGPLDNFVDSVKETTGVIGEEYVEMEGIDIGVGL